MRMLLNWTAAIYFLASLAQAQITDQEQRMRWFYLQKLATDVKELELCVFNDSKANKIQQALDLRTDELATAVEDFINRYSANRAERETIPAFRYRVWDVALKAGTEKARPRSELSQGMYEVLTTPH